MNGTPLAEADRDGASKRRHADHPAVRLAAVFVAIAEHLYASGSDEQVLQRIAETAVSRVSGCDMVFHQTSVGRH